MSRRPLLGVAGMVLGYALPGLNDAVAQWLTRTLPVGELIAVRGLTVLAVVPLLARREGGLSATLRWVLALTWALRWMLASA